MVWFTWKKNALTFCWHPHTPVSAIRTLLIWSALNYDQNSFQMDHGWSVNKIDQVTWSTHSKNIKKMNPVMIWWPSRLTWSRAAEAVASGDGSVVPVFGEAPGRWRQWWPVELPLAQKELEPEMEPRQKIYIILYNCTIIWWGNDMIWSNRII